MRTCLALGIASLILGGCAYQPPMTGTYLDIDMQDRILQMEAQSDSMNAADSLEYFLPDAPEEYMFFLQPGYYVFPLDEGQNRILEYPVDTGQDRMLNPYVPGMPDTIKRRL
ncbi:MAG: hypothetical protein V1725_03975 [archaeon]